MFKKLFNRMKAPVSVEKFSGLCPDCGCNQSIVRGGGLRECDGCSRKEVNSILQAIEKGKCPDCGAELYEGPSGCASMNVVCGNGQKFNYLGWDAERI